ncbi:hypothetical protein BH09MYX1_BH09MYX1_32740 [soil metagenome]
MFGAIAGALVATIASRPGPGAAEPHVAHGDGLAARKSGVAQWRDSAPPLLTTLLQTHSPERVPLDAAEPSQTRFDALLMDRTTNEIHPLDPRLLAMLRTLAQRHTLSRIELVSGYRSPKLNEMLRKKGHHVASHSQHSLGHAVDFRLVEVDAEKGIDPRKVEAELRALDWDGGIGTYLSADDWFVHMDVGPNRRWNGQ